MGLEGWSSCTLASPVNIGMATASALNPQLVLCLYFVAYLFWFLFHYVLHLKFSGLWEESGI